MKAGVVVPCTDSKLLGPVRAAVRDLQSDLPLAEAAVRWVDLLTAARPCSTARDLYRGPGWMASLGLVAALQDAATSVDWRIISAGYGLLHPEEQVTCYSATFIAGQSDSVPGTSVHSDAASTWWAELNQARGRQQPLLQLASEVDGLLVAASASYVDAVTPELLLAAERIPTVVYCAGRPRDPKIAALTPAFDRRLREGSDSFVRGGDVGFNQRVASRVVEELGVGAFSFERADELLAAAMDREKPMRYDRRTADDETVMDFIGAALACDPSSSRTALLRRWREGGRACEQRRFGILYDRVVAERRRQLRLGEAARG